MAALPDDNPSFLQTCSRILRLSDNFPTKVSYCKEKNNVVEKVTNLCNTFDDRVIIDYAAVVRWPSGTFMKEHTDPPRPGQKPNLFAALVYLNDNFTGGYTQFEENVVKPEIGKLLLFSNSHYKHSVSKIEGSERFALSIWFNQK